MTKVIKEEDSTKSLLIMITLLGTIVAATLYFSGTETEEIVDLNKLYCGDDKCGKGENCLTCPKDCRCGHNEVCVDGVCKESICTDSDGGKNYYVRGKNCITTQDAGTECIYDKCDINTNQLIEHYCSTASPRVYTCPNGCEDGACIRDEDSYSAPGESQLDLATDGEFLYLVAWKKGTQYIYKLDKSCNVIDTYEIGRNKYIFGLTYDGLNFWTSAGISKSCLIKLGSNFKSIDEIKLPYGAPQGIAYSNGKIWTVYNTAKDEITVTDLNTKVTEFKFYSPDAGPYGLAATNDSIWLGGAATNKVYQINKSDGSTIDRIHSPSKSGYLSGLTYDGRHLWLMDNTDYLIYKIEVDH